MRTLLFKILGWVHLVLCLVGLFVAVYMPHNGINYFEDVRAISQQLSVLLAIMCLVVAIFFFIAGNAKTAVDEDVPDFTI